MKTTTKTVEVREEAYTYEEVTYECEVAGCDFKTKDEDEAKKHHAQRHSFRAKVNTAGTSFMWFESEEDYRSYHRDSDPTGITELEYEPGRFNGPGWYWMKSWSEPCARGCCTNYPSAGFPASEFRQELEEKVDELNGKLDELDELLSTKP